ncbi:DUF2793 domain-containing protein [Rhizobiaceae bacterium BDR2-2]|uniref:DUF2793 domain-containing protein n=1 Tax=Ectorhizobium quercum TaxID=2965071 RepID=A0AAE3SUI5_9HYPH|nr:DUF2793 domain-containing protein [Ectorhizobium quercum]MCX8996713.1 DUF2793 domain-containing protein [Ectorhizobium quercum]
MTENTANLEMPYILPSQAQKHVTHNEALQRLDATVQLTLAATLASPPASPEEGRCFAIALGADGEWSGRDGRIAMRQDGAWIYLAPRAGWRAWDMAGGRLLVYDGDGWRGVPLPDEAECRTLGISTAADQTNRLAVAADATLLTHAGNGHQLKINKAAAGDTASLLFQSDWTGFAEMGLSGNNEFSIKVGDGTGWATALAVTQSGEVHRPLNPAFRAWSGPGTLSPAPGSQTGFQHISNLQGDAVLDTALSAGFALHIPAGGLYFLSMKLVILSSAGHEITLLANGTTELLKCQGGASGSVALTQTVTGFARLNSGDRLSISHAGNAQLECGENRTELTGVML